LMKQPLASARAASMADPARSQLDRLLEPMAAGP
jgi:hypothetical protein